MTVIYLLSLIACLLYLDCLTCRPLQNSLTAAEMRLLLCIHPIPGPDWPSRFPVGRQVPGHHGHGYTKHPGYMPWIFFLVAQVSLTFNCIRIQLKAIAEWRATGSLPLQFLSKAIGLPGPAACETPVAH